MNPNFDPNQNPFESVLAGMKPQADGMSQGQSPEALMAMMSGQGGMPAPQGQTQGQSPMPMPQGPGAMEMPPGQLEMGKGAGKSKPLTDAIRALQEYINQSTDKDSILMGRNIIKLLTRLMDRAEEEQLGNLNKGY